MICVNIFAQDSTEDEIQIGDSTEDVIETTDSTEDEIQTREDSGYTFSVGLADSTEDKEEMEETGDGMLTINNFSAGLFLGFPSIAVQAKGVIGSGRGNGLGIIGGVGFYFTYPSIDIYLDIYWAFRGLVPDVQRPKPGGLPW